MENFFRLGGFQDSDEEEDDEDSDGSTDGDEVAGEVSLMKMERLGLGLRMTLPAI